MKTTRFLFRMAICTALLHGAAYADPSNQDSERKSSETHDKAMGSTAPAQGEEYQANGRLLDAKPIGSRAPDRNGERSHVSTTKTATKHYPGENRPLQAPKNTSGNTADLHQPGSSKSVGAAKNGFVEHRSANNRALLVRTPGAVPPAGPSLKNVRPRAPSSAILGGLANSAKSTAQINGTGFNRKP
jgi:hypothetical protein